MANLNEVKLIGRLTRDADMYQGRNDTKIAKINVACDTGYGENKKTDYISATCFGHTAEYCEKYLGKGRLVFVTGRLSVNTYEKKDGTKVHNLEVLASDVQGLDSPKAQTQKPQSEPDFTQVEVDIPF